MTTADDVRNLTHAGLAHAYSGTCCIDIDDVKLAVVEMRKLGIDLLAHLKAPEAVRITSGRKNRAKLLYAIETPLPSYKVTAERPGGGKMDLIDFRCATKAGTSVQDALPPTIHPTTGEPYRWSYGDPLVAHWSNLPPLPADIRRYWQGRITEAPNETEAPDHEYTREELTKLLAPLDPDTDYQEWVNVGMALHHATGGSSLGLDVWDEWSATGNKYRGRNDLTPHWYSFQGSGITVDYLFMQQSASTDDFEDVTDDPEEVAKEAKNEARFLPVRIGEWVSRPPPKWIIEGVLPEAEMAMIVGPPSSGKTFFALDLALHIAIGALWREKETAGGPVVWVAAEAVGSVRNRALAFARHHSIELDEAALWVIGETPSLSDVDHVRHIAKHAREIRPRVIVIDTLAAASGGANENSGEDMGIILAACRSLHRITGALILLVHHTGKDATKGARGWSGLKAAMQTEIEIAVDPQGDRRAKVTKQRDGEQDIEFGFKLIPVTLSPFDDKPQISCVVEPVDGVLVLDEIPHGCLVAAAINAFVQVGEMTLSHGEFEKILYKTSAAAGENPVEVEGEILQCAKVLIDAGMMVDDGADYTLISLPGEPTVFDEEDEFDS